MEHEYRKEIYPIFPPLATILFSPIFSDGLVIWSVKESYHVAHNYRKELEPEFYSDVISFQVTLYNLNYGTTRNSDNVTIEDAIDGLNESQTTIKKAKEVYKNMGTDGIFCRSDISSITGDSVTAAGNLIRKLKATSLIVPVKGYGKGKYSFIEPHK